MNSKVALIYENGEFIVSINDSIVSKEKDIEKSFFSFKQIIENNSKREVTSWSDIEDAMSNIKNDMLEINSDHKTLSFGAMKYFHATGKLFYMNNGTMTPLIGGYHFFKFVVSMDANNEMLNCSDLLELCKVIIEKNATYRAEETSFIVSSAKFNYGEAGYNFSTNKINKGASIENGSFEEYKKYILELLK